MASSHRLAALVLSLVLLGGIGAAVPEPEEGQTIDSITEPTEENTNIGIVYAPMDLEEARRTREVSWMQGEISNLWGMYLKEKGFSLSTEKIAQLEELSLHLSEAIEKYQETPSNYKWWNPSRKGTTLPKEADVHLMLATMAAIESKVDPKVVGKLGEVGILQCHRWCRKGYSQKEVKENPQLAIDLSVQFLAESIDRCGIRLDSLKTRKLKDDAWTKPVSVYGAGNSAIVNSRCMTKQFARWRVSEMKRLREEIRKQPGGGNGGEKVCEGTTAARAARGLSADPV